MRWFTVIDLLDCHGLAYISLPDDAADTPYLIFNSVSFVGTLAGPLNIPAGRIGGALK